MNKITEDAKLNEVKISLDSLKAAKVGDEVVVMTTDGHVAWFEVIQRKGVQGRYSSGTTIGLRDLATGMEFFSTYGTTLPEDIAKIRRVSAGVNKRTLDKLAKAPVVAKVKPTQPEGEFENILDVPEEPLETSPELLDLVETTEPTETRDPIVEPLVALDVEPESMVEGLSSTG